MIILIEWPMYVWHGSLWLDISSRIRNASKCLTSIPILFLPQGLTSPCGSRRSQETPTPEAASRSRYDVSDDVFSLSADLKYICQRIFLDFTRKICKLASLKPANSWETCWEISHIMLDKCEKVEIGSLMWRPSKSFTDSNHIWNGKSWKSTIKLFSSITILGPVFIRL